MVGVLLGSLGCLMEFGFCGFVCVILHYGGFRVLALKLLPVIGL